MVIYINIFPGKLVKFWGVGLMRRRQGAWCTGAARGAGVYVGASGAPVAELFVGCIFAG